MYHFQGSPPGRAPPYQQSGQSQYPGHPTQPQGPPGEYAPYAAHQQTQNPQYGQYASANQPQAPGVYPSSQPYQAPSAYASNQQPHCQPYQPTNGSNQAHQAGGFPHSASYQPSIQSCYNCGRSDHWAQNCPEPRRAVPAGALNGSRPLKKQKTTGPIITRYPPPPNHSSPPSLQRGFTHPPVGRQAFPAPHGPLTPLSANGQSYNSWRPQQHPFVSQGPRQSSQQWTSPSMPTPTSSYGPQYASPVSMNGSTQHQNYFNSQSQAPANQTSPSANPTPLHASSTVESSNYQKQYLNSSRRESVSSDRNQASETNSENVEPWLEELQALDFTEGKVGSGLIISHPANPVAQALPSGCVAADAIGRLPIAASLPPGIPISMYFRDLDEQEFERNVREKVQWNEVCTDPAFAEINSDCDVVSIAELIKRRQTEALDLDDSVNEAEGSEFDAHSRDQYSDDEQRTRERSYSERSVTPFEVKLPASGNWSRTSNAEEQKHPTRSIENEDVDPVTQETEDRRLSREQEERLAALGVSGLPKPVQPSMRRAVAVTQPPKDFLSSPVEDVERQSRSASLDKQDALTENLASPSSNSVNHSSRGDSTELPHPGESPHTNGSATRASPRPRCSRENSYQGRNGHESGARYSSFDTRHPPPPPLPPPPGRKRKYFEETQDRHSPPADLRFKESTNNGHNTPPANRDTSQVGDILTPSRSRSEPHISRKRSYRQSSEESDDGPKRQEEENARRGKQKHPKVADAYSRRW